MNRTVCSAVVLSVLGTQGAAVAQWTPTWEAKWIGSNYDLGSSQSDPRYYIRGWNAAGDIAGISNRAVNSGLLDTGQDAWLFHNGETILIGLIDAQHTATSGKRSTGCEGPTPNGTVMGLSMRYAGNVQAGFSAWVYRNGTTTDITLPDAEDSDVAGVTDSGFVLGDAHIGTRYAAWRWHDGTRDMLGLTDAEHTGAGGIRSSRAPYMYLAANGGTPPNRFINELGHCIGDSDRYISGTAAGTTAWLYDGSNTIPLGLTDAEHTSSQGFRESHAMTINEAGDAAGYSFQYIGANQSGTSTWLYRGGVLTRLGLVGPQYQTTVGSSHTALIGLTSNGIVLGYTRQYGTGGVSWQVPWALYNGAYIVLGIHDAAHTGPNGEQPHGLNFNGPTLFSLNGVVAGTTARYESGIAVGENTWWWTAASGMHVMDQQAPRGAEIRAISPSGLLAGYDASNGGAGWVLDPSTGVRTNFDPVSPWSVNDNGRVTGWFSGGIFLWSPQNGITNLADLVEGGFVGCDWSRMDVGNPIYTDPIVTNDFVLAGAFGSDGPGVAIALFRPLACGSADFNHDCDVGTDQDIEAFFACLGGTCCDTCGSVDFNHDGDVGTDQDIEAFFRVLGGGNC